MLRLHERVVVEVARGRDVERHSTYVEATGPQMARLAVPLSKAGPVRMAPGTKVKVFFLRDGVRCWFESEVAGPSEGSEDSFTVLVPDAVNEVQRREFVRFEACVPVEFRVVFAPAEQGSGGSFRGMAKSIGGGGLLLGTERELAPGTILELALEFTEGEPVRAAGEVMRAVAGQDGGAGRRWFGVTFVAIEERQRDRLIGYIFARQRGARARGLL